MGGPPRLWSVPYKDYTAAPIVFGPDRGGPVGDIRLLNPPERLREVGINSNQPGGRRRKTRRKKQRGGNPQKDMHDAIKEDHELGVKQAIHNGAKVNQPRNYTKPKPLEKDTPEGRVCTGEVVMRKGKHTPLIRAVQENSMMGIVEDILGDRVGQEPGIDLKFKDPYYEPPKTAQEIAEEMGNKGALKRIKERANSDAGLGSGGIQQGEDDKKENIYEFD
jgi:hypothetical protein